MEQSHNPVDDLIEIGKQNQVLLSKIAVNQEMLLSIGKEQKELQGKKFIWEIVKYCLFVVLIFISFFFTQSLVENLTSNALGGGTNKQSIDIGKLIESGSVDDLLKSMQ